MKELGYSITQFSHTQLPALDEKKKEAKKRELDAAVKPSPRKK